MYNPYGEPYGMSRQQRYDNILNGGVYSSQSFQTQPNQPPMNNIIWVQGEAGAKAFQIPPNSNIILMDNDDLILYVKSTDNVGMASTRAFRLTEITNETPNSLIAQKVNVNNINYVTREEFEQLKGMIENAQSNFYSNANANTANANEKYSNNGNNRQKSNDK